MICKGLSHNRNISRCGSTFLLYFIVDNLLIKMWITFDFYFNIVIELKSYRIVGYVSCINVLNEFYSFFHKDIIGLLSLLFKSVIC